MKIIHIVSGLWTNSGGLATHVLGHAYKQKQAGHEVKIITLSGEMHMECERIKNEGIELIIYARSHPYCLYFSWCMLFYAYPHIQNADVINIHSNWTFPIWWGSWLTRYCKKPLLLDPQGCFDPIRRAHSSWKKKLVGWLDRECLKCADGIVVTCTDEKKWVDDFVGDFVQKDREKRLPLYVIPNGIGAPESTSEIVHAQTPNPRQRTVLSLGRLHPLKGLDLLVEAWARMKREVSENSFPWVLVIAGPDEQRTKEQLCAQMYKLGLRFQNVDKVWHVDACVSEKAVDVIFLEAVHGEDKWALMCRADVFVLPSQSENFGIVVGEALACKVPVVMTDVGPWKDESTMQHVLDEKYCEPWSPNGAIRFVEPSADSLATGLTDMMSLSDEERGLRGVRGCEWVRTTFSWDTVAKQMVNLYETVLMQRNKGVKLSK